MYVVLQFSENLIIFYFFALTLKLYEYLGVYNFKQNIKNNENNISKRRILFIFLRNSKLKFKSGIEPLHLSIGIE